MKPEVLKQKIKDQEAIIKAINKELDAADRVIFKLDTKLQKAEEKLTNLEYQTRE